MASQLRLRHAPTLEFVPDTVPGQGARIDRLLAELEGPGEPPRGAPVNQSPGSEQEGSGA